jgi:hypothetical protein
MQQWCVAASLEQRRRAVVEALRALNREKPKRPPAASGADLHAVEARLDGLSRQVAEVITRLSSVETAVLESAWEHPHPAASQETPSEAAPVVDDPVDEPYAGDGSYADDERVSVPAVPLGEGRMSSAASRALFGG